MSIFNNRKKDISLNKPYYSEGFVSKPMRPFSHSYNYNKDIFYIGALKGILKINVKQQLDSNYCKYIANSTSYRINDITSDKNTTIFGSQENGLFYITKDSLRSIPYEELKGLTIQAVELNNEKLWIGTNKGLFSCLYKINDNQIQISDKKQYSKLNGLNSNFIKDIEIWNDMIWIASNEGVCYGDEKELLKPIYKPILIIDEVKVNGIIKEIKNEMALENNENDFQINYKAITPNKSINSDFYLYQLNYDNNDDTKQEWYSTNNRTINFHDLKSGNYTFNVKCIDANNIESNTNSIHFFIKPKLTETTYFRAGISILALFILGALWRIRSNYNKKQLSLQIRAKNAELNTIRNQINPHFIFNALNALQNYIFSNKKIEANLYIHSLAKLIRRSLSFSREEFVSLEQEIDYIREYLLLEKMRFPDRFDYQIHCNSSNTSENIMIPTLVSQPIIENSIKHAFKGIKYKGLVDINYQVEDDHILIIIGDNGIGFKEGKKGTASAQSYGIKIIKERIKLINDLMQKKVASIKYENNVDRGVTCYIVLPIKYK